jgi:RHS repeat-associated protein
MVKNNQSYYYHFDGLGSVIGMTDISGNIVQAYEYDSFGNIVSVVNQNFTQPYTYTSREYDSETGLYYYRARYYDAKTGRFISEDPIGLAGGDINFYVYVFNSPLNLTDPDGKSVIHCIKALYYCGGECKKKAMECREKHEDPQACFDRGEPEVGSSHLIKECYAKIPECTKCVEYLLKCGYQPIPFPRPTK